MLVILTVQCHYNQVSVATDWQKDVGGDNTTLLPATLLMSSENQRLSVVEKPRITQALQLATYC